MNDTHTMCNFIIAEHVTSHPFFAMIVDYAVRFVVALSIYSPYFSTEYTTYALVRRLSERVTVRINARSNSQQGLSGDFGFLIRLQHAHALNLLGTFHNTKIMIMLIAAII